jgi:hypothetical protein
MVRLVDCKLNIFILHIYLKPNRKGWEARKPKSWEAGRPGGLEAGKGVRSLICE